LFFGEPNHYTRNAKPERLHVRCEGLAHGLWRTVVLNPPRYPKNKTTALDTKPRYFKPKTRNLKTRDVKAGKRRPEIPRPEPRNPKLPMHRKILAHALWREVAEMLSLKSGTKNRNPKTSNPEAAKHSLMDYAESSIRIFHTWH
jgi:hypothetical protein